MLGMNLCKPVHLRDVHACRLNYFVRLCIAAIIILSGYIIIYSEYFRENGVIEGWRAVADRYAIDFVSPNEYTNLTVVNNPCTRTEVLPLLIIVTSAVKNIEQRKTIRKTWASRAKKHDGNASVLFLVGRSKYANLNNMVLDENAKFGDVIVENFLDTYYNLTIKSIFLLKWVKQNCRNAAFVMKMDDDVYLNIDNLIKLTKKEYVPKENFLMGKLYPELQPDRRTTSKWYVPEHVYPSHTYPDFLCGVGFLMSGDVAVRLFQESFKFKLFFLEDVFVTGICAENANIKRRNNIGFHFFEHAVKIECNAIHPHMILLSHYIRPREMRRMHEQLMMC